MNDAVNYALDKPDAKVGNRATCFIILMCLFLTIMLSNCRRVPPNIEGTYNRTFDDLDASLTFEEETFGLRVGNGSRLVVGRYDIRGETIKLLDDDCGDVEGVYRVRKADDRITFSLIEDACEGRLSVLEGEWAQKE